MKLGRKTLPNLVTPVVVALLTLSLSSTFAQTSQRGRSSSGASSGRPRGLPVKYQPGGAFKTPAEIEREEAERLNAPQDLPPAVNEPPANPADEPMLVDPPIMEEPMVQPMTEPLPTPNNGKMPPNANSTPQSRIKPPATKPAPKKPAPPAAVLPYEDQHNYSHSQPTYEDEIDSFAGQGEWDGGGDCCGSCSGGSCGGEGCCSSCGGHGCGIYGRGEYLLFWAAGQDTPALVTTSPTGVVRGQAGVIGAAGTTVLYGDDGLNTDSRSGARAAAGFWLSPCMALEGEYLTIGDSEESFSAASGANGIPTIARPFVNMNGLNDANLVAYNLAGNAALIGTLDINAFSSFESSSLLLRYSADSLVDGGRYYQLDYLAGYRYARLRDNLSFASSTRSVEQPSSVPVGTVIDIDEQFQTTNRFVGADFGVRMHSQRGAYSLDVNARCAVGSMARELHIEGTTVTSVPGAASVTSQGGLLTQRSNIGRYRDDMFSVMPDVNIKLGMALHPRFRLTAGYNFIALANVARAGEQIDTTLNLTQAGNRPLNGDPRPGATFQDTSYWAHGLSFGVEGEF